MKIFSAIKINLQKIPQNYQIKKTQISFPRKMIEVHHFHGFQNLYMYDRALSYIYNNSKKKLGTNSLISKNAYQLKSMENSRFDKIKRENEIIKEVDTNGTFSFKGV